MATFSLQKRFNPFAQLMKYEVVRNAVLQIFCGVTVDDQSKFERFVTKLMKADQGEVFKVEMKFPRNYKYHCKLFKMLTFAFEHWEPAGYQHKNFEKFREDVLIRAGHYEMVIGLSGKVTYKAKSIDYASLDDAEFDRIYSACVDVVLQHVLQGYADRDEFDQVIQEALSYA